MTYLPLRDVATSSESVDIYGAWLASIAKQLQDGDRDRNVVVRNLLREIYFPALATDSDESRLPAATRDVRPYHVNVGLPAKSVRVKSIAPPEHQPDVNVPHED